MSLRTEGDIVFASNAATDLEALVRRYLGVHRKYADGINGIKVPASYFVLIHQPTLVQGQTCVSVTLVYTSTASHSVPQYYDVDDESFCEAWGASNVSHYTTEVTTFENKMLLQIPCALLLLPPADQATYMIKLKERKDAEAAEAQRQAAITELKRQLAELEQTDPVAK